MTGHKNPIISAVTALLTASAKRQEKQNSLFEKKFLDTLDQRVDAAVEKRLSAMKDNSSGMSPAEVSKLKQEIKEEVGASLLKTFKEMVSKVENQVNAKRTELSKSADEMKGVYGEIRNLVAEFEKEVKKMTDAASEFSREYVPGLESFTRASKRLVTCAVILSVTVVATFFATIFVSVTAGTGVSLAGLAAVGSYAYFSRDKKESKENKKQ